VVGVVVLKAVVLAVVVAAFGGDVGAALAAQPANDDYLSATRLEAGSKSVTDSTVTTDATTQVNVLAPDRSGPAEPTSCLGTSYGKTVWYVFRSPRRGVTELRAGGFDAVVAVYNYDAATSALGSRVACADKAAGSADLFVPVRAGRSYAVQIGGEDRGAGPASGTLQLGFDVFGDADGDGILDELDQCPRRRGVQAGAGCPPRLNALPTMRWVAAGAAVKVLSLIVAGAPRGARVELRCRRNCSVHQVAHVKRPGVVKLRNAAATLQSGSSLELRVTVPASAGGDYRYGAIGKYFRFDIKGGDLHRTDGCLLPGSRAPRRNCR